MTAGQYALPLQLAAATRGAHAARKHLVLASVDMVHP